jgi:hypothetical protein
MRGTAIVPLLMGCALVAALPEVTEARVVRFVVEQRASFAEGATFGEAGAYERLTGTAYFEVDPNDPLNAVIVDLDLAPRNARGRVAFSTPFFILKPVDMSRGNKKILYTANNRGNDALLNAKTRADVGLNDFPLRMGFRLYARRCGLARRHRAGRDQTRGEPADRDAAGRECHRGPYACRVRRPQHDARRRVHAEPRREPGVSVVRDRRHQSGALDADRSGRR